MEAVQADERIVSCAEKICGDGQAVIVDQAVPFLRGAEEKQSAENDGEQPQEQKCAALAVLERFLREVDRQAAGEETNRVEDRCFENFAWSWAGETFSHVIKIGDDENREDGGLGDDETRHADFRAIWEFPRCGRFRKRSRGGAHRAMSLFMALLFIEAVRIFGML